MTNQEFINKITIILNDNIVKRIIVLLNPVMPKLSKDWWRIIVIPIVNDEKIRNLKDKDRDLKNLDLAALLKIFKKHFSSVNYTAGLDCNTNEGITLIGEMQGLRNKVAHISRSDVENLTDDDKRNILYQLKKFIKLINGSQELLNKIEEIKKEIEQGKKTKPEESEIQKENPEQDNKDSKESNKRTEYMVGVSDTIWYKIKNYLIDKRKAIVGTIILIALIVIVYFLIPSSLPPLQKVKKAKIVVLNFNKLNNENLFYDYISNLDFGQGCITVIRDNKDKIEYKFTKSKIDSIMNFDKLITKNNKARFNSIAYFLKTAINEFSNNNANEKIICILGNLPQTPMEIVKLKDRSVEHLFLGPKDWQAIKRINGIKFIFILNTNEMSNTTDALLQKIIDERIHYEKY